MVCSRLFKTLDSDDDELISRAEWHIFVQCSSAFFQRPSNIRSNIRSNPKLPHREAKKAAESYTPRDEPQRTEACRPSGRNDVMYGSDLSNNAIEHSIKPSIELSISAFREQSN